jgi:hypothetical protein
VASRKWPRYEVGHKDYIFALGVISANFNELEGGLRLQFAISVRLSADATNFLFTRLDNSQRIALIRHCLTELPYNEREKHAIEHFMKGYAICAENRNILLHAEVHYAESIDSKRKRVMFYKDSKKPPYFPNRYIPSLKALRGIADAMSAFSEYGSDLAWMLRDTYWMEEETGLKNLRRPLPYKPPLPKLLVPKPPGDFSLPTTDQFSP